MTASRRLLAVGVAIVIVGAVVGVASRDTGRTSLTAPADRSGIPVKATDVEPVSAPAASALARTEPELPVVGSFAGRAVDGRGQPAPDCMVALLVPGTNGTWTTHVQTAAGTDGAFRLSATTVGP